MTDHLKDIDNIGFVYQLPPAERPPWLEWMRRIRKADELAETDLAELVRLRRAWWTVRVRGFAPGTEHEIDAWHGYLDALAVYHAPGLVIRTLAEHDEMLLRLSGPLLQLAPGMPEHLWDAAAAFGALDQYLNNLRDLQADAVNGMCFLPADFLRQYGIGRDDVIAERAPDMPKWESMMATWLWHGSRLQIAAEPFVRACEGRALVEMLCWTGRRHSRIRRVLADVRYDYRRFPGVYWDEVSRDLELLGIDTETAAS